MVPGVPTPGSAGLSLEQLTMSGVALSRPIARRDKSLKRVFVFIHRKYYKFGIRQALIWVINNTAKQTVAGGRIDSLRIGLPFFT
jgi:hypothetical protein